MSVRKSCLNSANVSGFVEIIATSIRAAIKGLVKSSERRNVCKEMVNQVIVDQYANLALLLSVSALKVVADVSILLTIETVALTTKGVGLEEEECRAEINFGYLL